MLDAIDDRLTSIERQVGIAGAAPESDELRRNSEQLARTRAEQEAALDAEDLVAASALRGRVRQLLAEREQLSREPQIRRSLRARQPSAAQITELEKARAQIVRLTAVLQAHGIDPGAPPPAGEPGDPTQTATFRK